VIQFGQYSPDQAEFYSAGSPLIKNVIPTAGGFRPFPALSALTEALAGQPQGFFFNVEDDGSVVIFAATATKLYKLDTTDNTWDDVSRTASSYTGNATQGWTFTKFGAYVIATNGVDAVQVWTVGSSSNFADLAGSPPLARRATVVGNHVVLYGLADNPNRIQWSGLDNIEAWTPGRKLSGYQDFPEGGEIMYVAPVERSAIVLQKTRARMMQATGESSFIFTFSEIEKRGAVSHRACTTNGTVVYFLAEDGFFAIAPGGRAQPIGAERVDRTVKDDLSSQTNYELVHAANDPVNKIIVWAYSDDGTGLTKQIGYQWELDRWVSLDVGTLYGVSQGATANVTLEQIGALYATLADIPVSLDSPRWLGGRPVFAAFDSSYRLGFFDGDNLEATVDTADLSFQEGRRSRVRAFRPITDAGTVYGQVGNKATWNDPVTWGTERLASTRTARCVINQSGFLHRFRVRIPAGETWTTIAGIDAPEITLQGRR
jgi:hypothetical protein